LGAALAKQPPAVRVLVGLVLRVLVALIALQVAGLSLCAACVHADGERGCPVGCTDNAQDQGLACSPFCPTCTCVHARPPSLARAAATGLLLPPGGKQRPLGGPAEQAPSSPAPERLFRPPRDGVRVI
jgi:hypothetical protein